MSSPARVAVVFGGLLCITCYSYFFSKPESIDASIKRDRATGGYWGHIDADFNWCEGDYIHSEYVAETVNVWTSFVYLAPPLVALEMMPRLILSETRWILSLVWIALIGLGSAAFHTTLRYQEQLCDELPMHGLMCTAAFIGLRRRDGTTKAPAVKLPLAHALATGWATLAVGLVITARESAAHQFLRGAMSVTFSMGFVYILTAASACTRESRESLVRLGLPHTACDATFSRAFWCFVVGLVGWLLDNFTCGTLHNLPFGLPYPHFHGCVSTFVFLLWTILICLRFPPSFQEIIGTTPSLVSLHLHPESSCAL